MYELIDETIGDTRRIVDFDVVRDEYRVRAIRDQHTASLPVRRLCDIEAAFTKCCAAITKQADAHV